MKLFLNWNGRNAIMAAAMGYVSMTMSSSFTSSSSSSGGQQQQQQGFGFVLYVAAAKEKICTCIYPPTNTEYDCTCPNGNLEDEDCCPLIPSCNEDDAEFKLKGQDGAKSCAKIEKKELCDDVVKNSDGATAAEFCYSCDTDCSRSQSPSGVPTGVPTGVPSKVPTGVPSKVPTGVPTPSPPDDKCKGDDDEIDLKNKGLKKCSKIEEKEWCGEEVKKAGGDTAEKFCTSCGCGACKGDDDEIDIKNKGLKSCKKIEEKEWCEKEVVGEGGATAEKFCTSCGCGDDPTGVPTGVPAPSPPDDECKGDKDEIDLKKHDLQKCSKIKTKKWCDEKVKNTDGAKAKEFCTSCGCGVE